MGGDALIPEPLLPGLREKGNTCAPLPQGERGLEVRGVKLFRLWGLYARMDLLWVTRDLKMFLIWYTSDMVFSVASITGMLLLAERFSGIGDWNQAQIVFMLGYAAVAAGLVEVFFGYNVCMISRRLGRGQLDHTLIQPQPLWLSLLTE